MEALLSYHHRGNKNIAGPSGDLPWNRLSFYFGHNKKSEIETEKSLLNRIWYTISLRFEKEEFEERFDEVFCHQNIPRCHVVIWFMVILFLLHYIFELAFSKNNPQVHFFSPDYIIKSPPIWAHVFILVIVIIYGGYIFQMSRKQRFFFTRTVHVLMVSSILVIGFALLSLIILTKDIGPPITFIVFFSGIYISPPSKFPIISCVCSVMLLSLFLFLVSQKMLDSYEKLSYFFLLCLSNFLGMTVISQIEVTIRHEFLQIYNTKVAFRDLIKEQAQWEALISTILPIPVAKALREKSETTVSEKHSDVSIMFAEIVDFETHIALMLSPDETVIFLNRIYMIFDRLIDTHKLEKIKTIGPIILIAGGLNVPADEHLRRLVDLGTDMILEMERLSKRIPLKIFLRIGINSGEVVAGVIGKTRLCYDVWGNTVNTASRMMTHGTSGKIHFPYALSSRLYAHYVIEDRGEIDIKGKGSMRTAFIGMKRNTHNNALALHFLPPLYTTLEKKLGRLNISAEMQTKDQPPEDPFRRNNVIGTAKNAAQMMLRKNSAATLVQSGSPGRRHHKVSPLASPTQQYSKIPWQEQMDNLLTTNIAGENDKKGEGGQSSTQKNTTPEVVVDRDFFSKWSLRYHHQPFEVQFHLYRSVVNSRSTTLSIIAGLILNSFFGLIDFLLSPRSLFTSQLCISRFGIIVPVFLVALLIARIGKGRLGRGLHVIACILVIITAAGVLVNSYLALNNVPQSIYNVEYALVFVYAFLFTHVRFLYFVLLYTGMLLGYIISVVVVRQEMLSMLKWGLMPFLVLGGVAIVSSYKTEQLIRTEWLLITMGERSKRKREKQKETVEDLLSNILPKKVVQRLKGGYVGTFAEDYANCTVMFADVCDFGDLLGSLSPTELVTTLDAIFSGFDTILEQYPALEKVKTIGDCYMVVGGALEQTHSDHAQQMVNCALDMLGMIQGMSIERDGKLTPLAIRIGIHSGLVHAGLIGWTKMIYDMWGETVDIAKLCESQGVPDVIQITHTTFNQLRALDFRYEPSQPIIIRPDKKIDTISISARNFRKDMDRYVG